MADTVEEPDILAVQACLRQALQLFLENDEVEFAGRRARVERLHEDRTASISFPGGAIPEGITPESDEAEPKVVAVEVWSGALIDRIRFAFDNGSSTDYGGEGGNYAGSFPLQPGEVLSRVSGTSGDSLDSVQFHTSQGRSSQIFGNAHGGRPFDLRAPSGQAVVGVRRRVGRCAALADLICSSGFRPGQRVVVQGLSSRADLNGKHGVVQGPAANGRLAVDLSASLGSISVQPANLLPAPEARVLLRDCRLCVPQGHFKQRKLRERDVEVIRWQGQAGLTASGMAQLEGVRQRPTRQEGVHHLLRVASSAPLPQGAVARLRMQVTGMDQGWGNSGDSGLTLFVARAGSPNEEPEFVAGVTYDHNRHRSEHHDVEVNGLVGALAPQPGDRILAELRCPNYPGWSCHVTEVVVTLRCVTEEEEVLPGDLPTAWEDAASSALPRLREALSEGSRLEVDSSHLSLKAQERQRVWTKRGSSAPSDADAPEVMPRLRALCGKGSSWGAEKLLEKLDSCTVSAGAPQEPGQRRARYGAMRASVHRTFDALEGKSEFLETVCKHYADASSECIYRWEREIACMHDLATGAATGSDSLEAEDAILRVLCEERRRMAEALLHKAKGTVRNNDMHFENYFYGSIHFGLPEQLEAARDPNRLNYGSLNMMRPGDAQQQLMADYTPAATREIVRRRVLDSSQEGAQALREKLLDWLRSHVPPGFQPKEEQAARQEAWLFEECHDADFQLRDWALNLMLCAMHVLRADRIACLVGDLGDSLPAEHVAGLVSHEQPATRAEPPRRNAQCNVQ